MNDVQATARRHSQLIIDFWTRTVRRSGLHITGLTYYFRVVCPGEHRSEGVYKELHRLACAVVVRCSPGQVERGGPWQDPGREGADQEPAGRVRHGRGSEGRLDQGLSAARPRGGCRGRRRQRRAQRRGGQV